MAALALGGTHYPWGSATIAWLAAGGAAMLVLFARQERREREPLIPLGLFRNAAFSLATGAGFVVNLARWSPIVYLPLYLQAVHGISPTGSGLRLVPMMVGVVVSSVVSGRLISRRGHCKVFPVVGTALTTIGLYLLSGLDAQTTGLEFSFFTVIVGLGLGMVMQVLVLVVQNAVGRDQLGVATSSATFVRALGGAVGVAIFGAVFANRFAYWTARLVTGEVLGGRDADSLVRAGPDQLLALPPAVHVGIAEAYARSLQTVFLCAVPFAALAFLITLCSREQRLGEDWERVVPT